MGWRPRPLLFLAFIALLNLAALEALSYAFSVYFLRYRGVIYVPDVPDHDAFAHYLAIRDPVLGWPSPLNFGTESRDLLGSRPNTFFPDAAAPACVSTYGDSFTYSTEVDTEAAWPNQLSRLMNCRVNNFGEGGYGTDQAVLRFQQNHFDRAPVVVLAHTSENIIRNVNQFRHFLGGERFGFKPRFVKASSGQYVLEPIMDFRGIDYRNVYLNPKAYFKHDYFIPDGPSEIPFLRFPYSIAMARSFFSYKFTGYLDMSASYLSPFYDPRHPSGALGVTAFIIRRFRQIALERGSLPILAIIPIADDMFYYESRKVWPYQSLLSYLENDLKIDFVNFGEALWEHARRQRKEVCNFYREAWYSKVGCTGHFNEEGYLLLARVIAGTIK